MSEVSHPLERALSRGLRRFWQWGVPLTAVALVFPAPDAGSGLLTYTLAHLTILQLISLILVVELAVELDHPWFPLVNARWVTSAATLIALVTGFAALLTLATSAAARYDVSLQFLQLLSSLDIAWVTAALFYGASRLWGRASAWVAGLLIVGACVASIGAYLAVVGFTATSGWAVDGSTMMRIVIPSDMTAAAISLTILFLGSRRRAQPTEQPSAQS